MVRSTISAPSRIGPKAGARSTSRPSPAGERRAADGWITSRARGTSRQRPPPPAIEVERTNHADMLLAAARPAMSALDPLKHRVEKRDPLLLQIAQHVFGHHRISLPDQDVKAERWQ